MSSSLAHPHSPAKKHESDSQMAHSGQAAEPQRAAGRNEIASRVLVVDDHPVVAGCIAQALRKRGHEVRMALDSPAAIEEATAFQPHVVFSDIALPRMNGLALASRLREIPGLRNAVLVAITGFDDEDTVDSIQQVFDHYLTKPPDPVEMNAIVRSAVLRLDGG